jgi:RNA polymerase sigma-70 factor (ECF subfamily)
LHDAVERALRSLDRFEVGTNVRAWMRTIMARLAIDRVRACRRRPTQPLDDRALVWEAPEPTEQRPWTSLSMDDVRAVIDHLPEKLRIPFRMFALEGLPYEEIGRRLGIPQRTVGTRLLRARAHLRRLLLARLAPRQLRPAAHRTPVTSWPRQANAGRAA